MERGKGIRDLEAERVEREIEEQARRAFLSATGERVRRLDGDIELDDSTPIPAPSSSASSSASSAHDSLDNSSAHLSDPSELSDQVAMPPPPPPSSTTTPTTSAFQRKPKTKKDFASTLGIKKPVASSPAIDAEKSTDPPPDRSPATVSTHAANGVVPPKKEGVGLVDYGSESSDED
ncbi:hypothetical protein KC352_g27267 [Hortaea werneckii]|nr:hypothetical protein KC352_g27267 [Hortaea werneckii]